MAIAIDIANLGTAVPSGGSTTVAFNTTSNVASSGFIVVCAGNFGDHVVSCAGGGLTWALDKEDDGSAGGNGRGIGIFSAQAPAGLASGTTITVTFSASTNARTIAGLSFTGVATSSPIDVINPSSLGNRASTAAWTTGSMSISAGSVIVAMCWNEGPIGSSAPTAPSLESSDIFHAVDLYGQVVEYRIESSAGSYTVAGTWNAAAGNSNIAVAYKAAAGGASVTNEAALRTAHTPVTWRT